MGVDSVTTSASSAQLRDQIETDNARIGYQAAISLVSLEGNIVWARYGLMLLAHTIILSVVGLTSNASQPAKGVIWVGLSLTGLVLCRLWWVLNDVGFRYFFYWLLSARELEERYLAPIRIISRGIPVTADADVSVVVDGKQLQLPITERDRHRVVRASKLLIGVFAMLYAVLLISFVIVASKSLWS